MTSVDERDTIIAGLRQRLAEAEDTLNAIRQGEVDALVVGGTDAEEIFTIEGESEAYRTFMEAMEPGAAALDSSGRVLYANTPLLRLLGVSLEVLQGTRLRDAFDAGAAETIDTILHKADSVRHSRELRLHRNKGGDLHFIASATPLRLGAIAGHAVTFADVTERVRAEAAEQSERAARAVISSANQAVLVCDREGFVTHANAAASIVYDGNPVGLQFSEAVPLIFPGATGIMQADDVVADAIAGNAIQGIEAVAPKAPEVKDYLLSAAPLQVAGDQISGCVITMVDLSQRKAAEKQQLLLMAELDHRVKNTLALVLSISRRTLSSEDTLEGFQKAFTGRIQALAATHNLLADKSWTDLSLRDVVLSELAPYVEASASRVVVEAGDVTIAPRAAIALGLVVHELATNAVKYGALSRRGGRIVVGTPRPFAPGDTALLVEWRESGGPDVAAPTRSGFGRTVIARSFQYSQYGGAEIIYEATGVVCRISIPAEDLRQPAP